MAVTFVVSNRKGGTGKTTVSVNLKERLAVDWLVATNQQRANTCAG